MSDTKFVTFIFSESNHSQKSWIEAYISLQRSPAQASNFLASRELSGAFIAGFEVYGMRMAKFLQQVPRYTPKATLGGGGAKEDLDSKQALGGHLIKKVLIPLLGNEYRHLHTRDALFELLVSSMALSDRVCFDQLAARLGEIPQLLGKMISEQRSSNLIGEWVKFLVANSKSMQNWAETVVNLAENCDSDHGVSQKTERWGLLKELRIHLHKAKHQLDASQQIFNPAPIITSQTKLRVLNSDEDFYGRTRRTSVTPSSAMSLTPEALTLLSTFGMDIPHSERTLLYAIEAIETAETLNILEAVINTFPCRLCFKRGYGNASEAAVPVIQTNFEERLDELDLDSFEGLLGSDLGIWKISLSAQALKDLKHSKREGNFPHIKDKLMALASGEWGRKAVAKPVSDDNGRFKVRVFQAWYGSNGRIMWQVDVGFDEKHNADSQIVRVWRIGDVKEMMSSLDSVYRAQQTFSSTRIERCKKNVIDKSQNKKIPAVFRDSEEDMVSESGPRTIDERTPQDMLISGKFHTLTSTVLDSILHGQSRSDFPFDVTGKEVEIIRHFRTGTFILGRSGTGKTSCLLYKLLSRYLARNLVESETPIRQLLLTRSEPLARKLESEVQLLIDTQLLRVKAGFSYADDDSDTPPHMRDGIDEDTTEDLFSLRKQDFPLVCTFGHFLKRLENTIKANDRKNPTSPMTTGKSGSSTNSVRQMVDFTIFKSAYWQQFPANIRAGLEPDLVFTEIMGVIKGAASLLTDLKPLSRDEYRSKSSRLAPTFAKEGDRDCVYNVFEYYEYKKKKNGDYDGIDRVKEILEELTRNVVLRRRVEALFEEVYVDEVQDQRPLEIELLLNLVQNPRGIHFAGDSAQCISKDSTFRFANVKALFYNHFSGSSFAKTDPALVKPELFSLSRNFRSHQGILSLASFVMELLWKGFPDMVDKLPPEIGQYLGPKPMIFVGSDLIEFLQKAGKSRGNVENKEGEVKGDDDTKQVKTRQVVIIRDQLIQEDLQENLGDGSLVFTILQSKGMEYDDVFLFDFFSTSPCLREFRSLEELLDSGTNPSYGVEHMNMCSELKNLYVAITRPRSRLWILESKTSFIMELFTERVPEPLVNIKYFKPEDLEGLMHEVRPASATSAAEWIETGEQCMDRGIFDQALRCFKNAQDTQRVLLAEASIAEQKGRESRARGDLVGLKSYFKEASNYFLTIEMKERAAHCLEASGDFAAAAELYSEKRRHEKAAGLFERAEMYEKAAREYHRVGITFKALQALYSGKLFDLLVRSVHKYRDEIEDGDRKVYARECNTLLRQGKISSNLRDMAFDIFISDLEKEEFLKEFQHKKELLEFYLTRGRITDAFKYSLKVGDFEGALELIIDRGSEYGVDLEESEDDLQLKEVFKYAETRKLFSNTSKPSTTSVDLSCDQRFSGSSWSRAWMDLVTVANGYFKDGIKPDRDSIQENWIKEYMDIIVSVRVEYFLKSGEYLSDLPVEYLCGLVGIEKEISQNKGLPIPKSVLLCLGVLLIPGESNSYVVLNWSPLDPKLPRTLDYDSAMKNIIGYIKKQIQNASSLIEKKARTLWENTLKLTRCDACVTRGKWDTPEKVGGPGSKCSHNALSGAEFSKSIQGLIRLCHSFDELEAASLDYWLDALLSQMRHNSSFFQDAGVIAAVGQTLCTSATYANVTQKLRNRFSSCWEPWRTKNTKFDFTSLLENYQLGYNLGVRKSDLNSALDRRFLSGQPQKPRGHPKARVQAPPPDLASVAFNNYQSLREQAHKSPSYFSTGRFCEDVCTLLQALLNLQKYTKCLSFYHGSVISIYEDIVTFLLFSIRRTDVIIPESWAKLYLPHWRGCFKTTTDLEQCCYQQILLRTVASFCDLITNLESSPQGRPSEKELLARRSVDFLVVTLTNMGTVGPFPLRYDEIWAKIQKVFGHKGLGTSNIQNVEACALVKPLTQAFELYNGKDSILVYIREGRASRRVESLDGTGIQFRLLPIYRSSLGHFPLPEYKLNAAFIIQAWYRRKRAKLIRQQKHLESPPGQAISYIHNFCYRRGAQMPRQEFLKFSAVMVTEGLELYLLLDMTLGRYNAIRDLPAKAPIKKYEVEFAEFEQNLFPKWDLFEIGSPSAFSSISEECQRKCKEELESTKSLGEQMDVIMQKLLKPPEAPKKKEKGKSKDDPKGVPGGGSKGGQKGGQKGAPKDAAKGVAKDGKEVESNDAQKDQQKNRPKDMQKSGSNDGLEAGQEGAPKDMPKDELKDGAKADGSEEPEEGGKEPKDPEGGGDGVEKETQGKKSLENEGGKGKEVDKGPNGGDSNEPALEKGGRQGEAEKSKQEPSGSSGGPQGGKDASVVGKSGTAPQNKHTGGGGKKKKSKKGKKGRR